MTGAKTGAIIPVKIFVERNQVSPVSVRLKLLVSAKHWSSAIVVEQKDSGKTARDSRGHFPERHHLTRTSRAFHFKIIAMVAMKPLQRFNQQIVEWKPYRPTPVGIAA